MTSADPRSAPPSAETTVLTPEDTSITEEPTHRSERIPCVICALVVLAIGVTYIVIGSVPLDFTVRGQPGAGFFPTLIGIVLIVIGVVDLAVESRKMLSGAPRAGVEIEGVDMTAGAEKGLGRDTALFAAAILAYCLLFAYVGVMPATMLFAIASTFLLERTKRIKTLAIMLPVPIAMIIALDLLVGGAMGVV